LSLFLLQKGAVKIIHTAAYSEHTNPLFLKSKLLKMQDLVKLYNAQFMFKAYLLPVNIQNMFSHKEQSYSLKGFGNCVVPMECSTRRISSMSVWGYFVE